MIEPTFWQKNENDDDKKEIDKKNAKTDFDPLFVVLVDDYVRISLVQSCSLKIKEKCSIRLLMNNSLTKKKYSNG